MDEESAIGTIEILVSARKTCLFGKPVYSDTSGGKSIFTIEILVEV
jgi:hypothetical protein